MQGIYTKPYLDLDTLLPIDLIDTEETMLGLAICPKKITYWGGGTYPNNGLDFTANITPPIGSSQRVKDFYERFPGASEELKLWTKLAYGMYTPTQHIALSAHSGDYSQTMIDENGRWQPKLRHVFPSIFQFIEKSEAFEYTGRIFIFLQEHDCRLPTHNDWLQKNANPTSGYHAPAPKEFLWLSPQQSKKFFIFDEDSSQKHYVTSRSAWFNVLDLHGADPVERMSWSLRIDGKFSAEFKKKLQAIGT